VAGSARFLFAVSPGDELRDRDFPVRLAIKLVETSLPGARGSEIRSCVCGQSLSRQCQGAFIELLFNKA
jgi:hypothetical protein